MIFCARDEDPIDLEIILMGGPQKLSDATAEREPDNGSDSSAYPVPSAKTTTTGSESTRSGKETSGPSGKVESFSSDPSIVKLTPLLASKPRASDPEAEQEIERLRERSEPAPEVEGKDGSSVDYLDYF